MAYLLLNIRTAYGTPIAVMWLSRTTGLIPFVDEYVYRIGWLPKKNLDATTAREYAYSGSIPSFKFISRYSRGLFQLWADGIECLGRRTDLDQDWYYPGSGNRALHIACTMDNRHIFETHIKASEDPGYAESVTHVVRVNRIPDVFPVDVDMQPSIEPEWVIATFRMLMARFPDLARPWLGERTPNQAKCVKCGTVIESRERHEFVSCKCGAISIDGGLDYFRRCGNKEDFAVVDTHDTVQYVKNPYIEELMKDE